MRILDVTRRTHRSLILAALLCVSVWAQAQTEGDVLDRTFLNSIVLISYTVTAPPAPAAGKSGSGNQAPQVMGVMNGTGFLVLRNIGITKGAVYLVTNRHVLPPEGSPKEIRMRVIIHDENGAPKIGEINVPITGADGKYLPTVRVHKNPATDVAAVDISALALGSKIQVLIDAVTTGKYLNPAMLLPTNRFRAVGVGLGSLVYILGYPAAIFDPRNVLPILRVGAISTDPQTGFNFNDELRRTMNFPEHIDGFLVDANIYPGSSGSLVISVPKDGAPGSSAANRTPLIVGIVSGSIPIFDASLRSYERIGLGMVYTAETIKDVLDSFGR